MSTLVLGNNITLKNSTAVVVTSNGQISSAQFQTGQEAILTVAQDVTVKPGGELVIVISAESPVYGIVKEVNK